MDPNGSVAHPLLHLLKLFIVLFVWVFVIFCILLDLAKLLVVPLLRPLDSLYPAHQHIPLLLYCLHPLQQAIVDAGLEGVPPGV